MISSAQLRELFATVRCVLLDFDGPICSIFANRPAPEVNARLRALVPHEVALPETVGPHETLQAAAQISPAIAQRIEETLAAEELAAAETATPTPGATELLRACADTNRLVVIVSNNHGPAVQRYIERAELSRHVAHVIGRDPNNTRLMKPHPHLLQLGLQAAPARAAVSAVIGDSDTDMAAGRAAGVLCIGYANKDHKFETLRAAGAQTVVASMHDLAKALRG